MPWPLLYGVLRGRPDRFKREDNTSSPHLQIRVLEDSGQPWRIAVNVQSNTGSHVAFWVVDPLVGHPVLASLPGRSQGFTTLAANAGQALDYVKAPLFDVALGRVLPPTGAASADDLQDLLSLFLEQCKAAGGEIFAFGAKFDAEPAQADRHRVRQHRRPARHPRHPHEPGERRRSTPATTASFTMAD